MSRHSSSSKNYLPLFPYICFAVLVFIVGLIVGYHSVTVPEALLQTLAETTAEYEKNHEYFKILLWIFTHNSVALLISVLLGPFSALQILFNGVVVGSLAQNIFIINGPFCFIGGILPHGIFEIPAIVTAAALGLRLFHISWLIFISQKNKWEVIANPLSILNNPEDSQFIKYHLKKTITQYCVIVLPQLLVAASIETYITPTIIKQLCR